MFKLNKKLSNLKSPVAVAVSGGRDSLSLFHFLSTKYKKITALIVDHKLRKESTEEANNVAEYIKSIGGEIHIVSWDGEKPTSNIHEVARNKRYELLLNYCNSNNIEHLFVGHNQDDQAETLFHRIYRGTGTTGLKGMNEKELRGTVWLHRPMLYTTRAEITEYAKKNKIPFIDDPSNLKEDFERVKIRKFLNSHYDYETLIKRFSLLSENSKRADDFINTEVKKFFEENIQASVLGFWQINLHKLTKAHEEIKFRFLSNIIQIFSTPQHPPRLDSIKKLNESLINGISTVLGGVEFLIKGDVLIILREAKFLNANLHNNIWDNRFLIRGKIDGYVISPISKREYEETFYPEKLLSKIFKTKPGVFDKDGKFIACPLLNYNPSNLDIEFHNLLK